MEGMLGQAVPGTTWIGSHCSCFSLESYIFKNGYCIGTEIKKKPRQIIFQIPHLIDIIFLTKLN